MYGSNRAGGVTKILDYDVATKADLGVMLANLGNLSHLIDAGQ
jgi:hypothetical protein